MLKRRACATRYLPKVLGILFALTFANVCLLAEEFAGTCKRVHGQVSILRGNQTVAAADGVRLLIKDVIQTGADGSAGVILHDGTLVSLGPASAVAVEDFVFDPANGKFNLFLKIFRGVVAYASGKIEQLSPTSVRVETPVAVIGLRGTRFAVSLDPKTSTAAK